MLSDIMNNPRNVTVATPESTRNIPVVIASAFRMGRRLDRHTAQRVIHQMRHVGEKSLTMELYIKPVVSVISHHCGHSSRDSHTLATHTCLCVLRVQLGQSGI